MLFAAEDSESIGSPGMEADSTHTSDEVPNQEDHEEL